MIRGTIRYSSLSLSSSSSPLLLPEVPEDPELPDEPLDPRPLPLPLREEPEPEPEPPREEDSRPSGPERPPP